MAEGVPVRPVVTGVGLVTAAGSGVEAAWVALAEGRSLARPWSPDGGPGACSAAPIPDDYRTHPQIPRNLSHFLDRGSAIAIDGALQALEMAGLGAGAGDSRRFGLCDGAAFRAPGQATLFVPYGHAVARVLGIRGPVEVCAGGELSGFAAIAGAARLIETGEADVVLAGAAQAIQAPLLEHLAGRNEAAASNARPFDAGHDGCVPAEAAAWLVLESEEHAKERGATVLGRLSGIAVAFDSTVEPLAYPLAPEVGRVQQLALTAAAAIQNQVDLLVSCADGREAIDFADGYGAMRTFGRHAFFAGVTAPAGALGFSFAASGPLNLALAVECLRRQATFPIAGLETPESGLELAYIRAARAEKLGGVMVTGIGAGGTMAAALLEAPKG